MALNVELKAKVRNLTLLNEALTKIGAIAQGVTWQEDTFFAVPRGRLKMRCEEGGQCELIYYRRRDEPGPKVSSYFRQRVDDGTSRRQELVELFGVKNIVRKKRTLYLINSTRVHLDEIEGMGDFVEIEVPIASSKDENRAKRTVQTIMRHLAINDDELLATAYVEMPYNASGSLAKVAGSNQG